MLAGRDIGGGEPDDLVVFAHRPRPWRSAPWRACAPAGICPRLATFLLCERGAGQEVGARDDDVVRRAQADGERQHRAALQTGRCAWQFTVRVPAWQFAPRRQREAGHMADRLKGKTALVTAAAQGIGRASALGFAPRAHASSPPTSMPPSSRSLARRRAARRYPTPRRHRCRAVAALAGELGAIDVLFNCAGFVHHGTVLECSEKDWDFTMNLNLRSMYLTIRAFLPAMLKRGPAPRSSTCPRAPPRSRSRPTASSMAPARRR